MESKIKFKPNPDYRLMDQAREVLRYYHYAYRTEQSYCSWILQYIKFYGGKTHPKDLGKNEVERFLSYLTEKKNVAAATQKQALNEGKSRGKPNGPIQKCNGDLQAD